jgi:hypothetical protein
VRLAKRRHRDAEADGARRDIDIVGVLGARRIGLRAAESAERFELLARLVAEQILDRMEHGARMRLYRDAILRLQHPEIERGHDRDERGGRGLVPADLDRIFLGSQVIRVVDRPGGQPQDLAFQVS